MCLSLREWRERHMYVTTHVHLVTKLMCKRVAALLYNQCLDNIQRKKKSVPLILCSMSERVFCYFVSWYLRYTINDLRACYGSQSFTNQMNPLCTIGRYFFKLHSNMNLPIALMRAKQTVVFTKDIETPVRHN